MHITPGLNNGGGTLGAVQIENASGTTINPATEETVESIAGFNIPKYDYVGFAYPDAVTVVVTYKTGGSGGTTVGTLTLVYTDSTQNLLSSVTKS